MRNDRNDLLDAVDALTKPIIDHLAQKADGGAWLRTHTVEHPPLLQQMHDAVNPSKNTSTGSASSKSTRTIIDADALFQYAKMAAQIGDWCRMVEVKTTRDPVIDLRRWYVGWIGQPEHDDTWHARALRSWARMIQKHLDPPKSFYAEGACPVCGATEWGDMFNGGGMWPVMIEYKLNDITGMPENHNALCQACRTVWQGYDSVMELSDEIKERREA